MKLEDRLPTFFEVPPNYYFGRSLSCICVSLTIELFNYVEDLRRRKLSKVDYLRTLRYHTLLNTILKVLPMFSRILGDEYAPP